MSTTQINETPELATLGSLSTGHHGVSLTMISVAPNLEVAYSETATREECLALNQEDARGRKVIWDAEELMEKGEVDEEGLPIGMKPFGIAIDTREEGEEEEEKREIISVEDLLEGAKLVEDLDRIARITGVIQDEGVVVEAVEEERIVMSKEQEVLKKKGKGKATDESDNEALRQVVSLIHLLVPLYKD